MHDGLLGTLLGYGRDNSWLFWQQTRKQGICLDTVWEDSEYTYKWRDETPFPPPQFVGDRSSEESKQLKQGYLQARKEILDLYEKGDFLETTLGLLCAP